MISRRGLALFFVVLGSGPVLAEDVLFPLSNVQSGKDSKYFLISIGVNSYTDKFWPALKWPVSDATRVADRIGSGARYQISRNVLLNESANLAEVKLLLDKVLQAAQADDTVVLYISSHGTLAQTGKGELAQYIVLHDTQKNRLVESALSHQLIHQWLGRLRARRKLVIIASCHSGEGKSRLPAPVVDLLRTNKGKLVPLSSVSEGTLVLAAAAKGESARESDQLKGDIYTHYLLEALTTYDRNQDGMVSALEAHDYARDRTWTFSQGRQRPTASARLIGDADIPLFGQKQRDALPILEAYDAALSGFFIQVDQGEKGVLPFAFPLDNDGSIVTLFSPDSTRLARYKVSLAKGEKINLQRVMNERPIAVSLSSRYFRWSDQAWSKVSGSADSHAQHGSVMWNSGTIGLGFSLETGPEQSNIVRAPLKMLARLDSYMGLLEYRLALDRRHQGGIRLEMGYERMWLKVLDTSTGEQIGFDDTAFAYGLSLNLVQSLAADLSLVYELGFRNSDWGFDTLGDLNGRRYWFGMALNYRFGWSARSIW